MGLILTKNENLAIANHSYFYCDEIPAKVLFKKASIRTNSDMPPTHILVKQNQGFLVLENGKVSDFCFSEGFYHINNNTSASYIFGDKDEKKISFDDIFDKEIPFIFEEKIIYFINFTPVNNITIHPPQSISFIEKGKSNPLILDGKFDLELIDPLKLFFTIVKTNAEVHSLTDTVIYKFKTELEENLINLISEYSSKRISYSSLCLQKNALIQNSKKSISLTEKLGIGVCNMEIKSIELTHKPPKPVLPKIETVIPSEEDLLESIFSAASSKAEYRERETIENAPSIPTQSSQPTIIPKETGNVVPKENIPATPPTPDPTSRIKKETKTNSKKTKNATSNTIPEIKPQAPKPDLEKIKPAKPFKKPMFSFFQPALKEVPLPPPSQETLDMFSDIVLGDGTASIQETPPAPALSQSNQVSSSTIEPVIEPVITPQVSPVVAKPQKTKSKKTKATPSNLEPIPAPVPTIPIESVVVQAPPQPSIVSPIPVPVPAPAPTPAPTPVPTPVPIPASVPVPVSPIDTHSSQVSPISTPDISPVIVQNQSFDYNNTQLVVETDVSNNANPALRESNLPIIEEKPVNKVKNTKPKKEKKKEPSKHKQNVLLPPQNNVVPQPNLPQFNQPTVPTFDGFSTSHTMSMAPQLPDANNPFANDNEWICPSCFNDASGEVCACCGHRRHNAPVSASSSSFIPQPKVSPTPAPYFEENFTLPIIDENPVKQNPSTVSTNEFDDFNVENIVFESQNSSNTDKKITIAETRPKAKSNNSNEWVCPDCGTPNSSKFCSECGTAKPQVSITCSVCGFIPPDPSAPPKFCPDCGNKFT